MSLADISADGRFCVLAIDHRDSLRQFLGTQRVDEARRSESAEFQGVASRASPHPRNSLSPDDLDAISAAELTELKIDIVRELAPLATGVMLEPEYSIPQVLDAGVVPDGVGFLAALESQGYLGSMGTAATTLLEGWSVQAAADSGAAAAKLLLPYHPDRPLAWEQEGVAAEVISECGRVGIALILEPLFYDLDDPADRPRVVLETARRFAAAGPDLLKLPFPVDPTVSSDRAVWLDRCQELDAVVPMPWALLSGGGDFEAFFAQVEVALEAGSAGCMVGRALWGDAARAAGPDRLALLRGPVHTRFERLRTLVTGN